MSFFPFIVILFFLFTGCEPSSTELEWPEITQQTKPWTRWWWMGNAVNKTDLTRALNKYHEAGLGGVEITPIYGVKGYENKFIDYLSEEWMDMLIHTLEECERLDMGVDMATGTGWPFGGPWVSADDACKNVVYNIYQLEEGETLNEPVFHLQSPIVRSVGRAVDISELTEPLSGNKNLQELALDQVRFEKSLQLLVLMAYSDDGKILDLTEKVDSIGILQWTAPEGKWKLYAVFQGWHGKMVERAAPGGETNVIDHFSKEALENYLRKFDDAFEGRDVKSLRAFFNDSYEVDDAYGQSDWTPDFFSEFLKRRGYDLRDHLPLLLTKNPYERNIRVLCDYRETISELLLEEFTLTWKDWASGKNALVRNQAHGSPANILDLYAASDIPETEGNVIYGIKLASSAANVTGKQLVSSESATWLDEHFLASLDDVKKIVDLYFLGGVNHIFYHGTTFSPQDEDWPGWMFYASVHFGPTNTFWNDFKALNDYITRCQSFLQAGKPDNDILLYFPFYDRISQQGTGLLEHFNGRNPRFIISEFVVVAKEILDMGYSLDYISDTQIKDLDFSGGLIESSDVYYKTLVFPECNYIKVEIFGKLIILAEKGAVIIFNKSMPADVPGFGQVEKRQKEYQALIKKLDFAKVEESRILKADIGKGAFLLGDNMEELLTYAKVSRESMIDKGLHVVRRKYKKNKIYFIVNRIEEYINDWIPIQTKSKSIAIYNPMSGENGIAATRTLKNGNNEVYLQLRPGESCILRTLADLSKLPGYRYYKLINEKVVIDGEWTINFVEGGPSLPADIKTSKLDSWTNLGGDDVKAFSGTAKYTISFNRPEKDATAWLLDVGNIYESAVLILNGKELVTLFSTPYSVIIPGKMLKSTNLLEIQVSNLMANRISYLDREGFLWKKFYNINFPARKRENRGKDGLFSAAGWLPLESGLTGPVTLIPAEILDF